MKTGVLKQSYADHIIRSRSDLKQLCSFGTLFKSYRSIRLELSGIPEEKSFSWEKDINRYYNACGCGEGKFFVFIGFIAFCMVSYQQETLVLSWKNVGIAFLYCMAGAAVGKLIGKYRAHLGLKRKISIILEQLNH